MIVQKIQNYRNNSGFEYAGKSVNITGAASHFVVVNNKQLLGV
jgi:hypothetical protein